MNAGVNIVSCVANFTRTTSNRNTQLCYKRNRIGLLFVSHFKLSFSNELPSILCAHTRSCTHINTGAAEKGNFNLGFLKYWLIDFNDWRTNNCARDNTWNISFNYGKFHEMACLSEHKMELFRNSLPPVGMFFFIFCPSHFCNYKYSYMTWQEMKQWKRTRKKCMSFFFCYQLKLDVKWIINKGFHNVLAIWHWRSAVKVIQLRGNLIIYWNLKMKVMKLYDNKVYSRAF